MLCSVCKRKKYNLLPGIDSLFLNYKVEGQSCCALFVLFVRRGNKANKDMVKLKKLRNRTTMSFRISTHIFGNMIF